MEIGMGVAVSITQILESDRDGGSKFGVRDLSHIFPPVQIGVAVKVGHELSAAASEFIADLKAAAVGVQAQSVSGDDSEKH